ncbi:MAG: HD domain-containing phosphohydrolase [Fimbriimonadales bacterium]
MLKHVDGLQDIILVVDDEPTTLEFLVELLSSAGYRYVYATSRVEPVPEILETVRPDLALIDWHLNGTEGDNLIRLIRAQSEDNMIPVVVLTADPSPAIKNQALTAGATDFLNKPFDVTEALLRIRNLLELRHLHRSLAREKHTVEQLLSERTRDLELARLEILERLARAAEYRDDVTGQHIVRVGRLSEMIGRVLGLDETTLYQLRHAAPLHDVGKIGIPDSILLKPGTLTSEEHLTMRKHTLIGARILEGCPHETIEMARQIALSHHERWDGQGYPYGLAGETIPLWGRIVAVADAYDAMTHDRPYRLALSTEQALEELRQHSGTQFDPTIVEAFTDPAHFQELNSMKPMDTETVP